MRWHRQSAGSPARGAAYKDERQAAGLVCKGRDWRAPSGLTAMALMMLGTRWSLGEGLSRCLPRRYTHFQEVRLSS
jgi:hypothetical protein